MKKYFTYIILLLPLLLGSNCKTDPVIVVHDFKTENVIIILIDGPRYSESWGEPTHKYTPGLATIAKQGVAFTNFGNDGTTNTINGHVAITTGYYESLDNAGAQTPTHVSIFQLYREKMKTAITDAWMIGSKDKLQVLVDCNDTTYKGRFNASTDCGVNGLATGYREDSVTFKNALATLSANHPHLAFISFKQPDAAGHSGVWNDYLKGLQQSDDYALQIWNFLQSDPHYKDKTTVFITNDHGRHLDGIADGFVSHGDDCAGCRHIMLLASGPDFISNYTLRGHYSLIDINATIGYLMGFKNTGKGRVINELFR